MTEYEWVTEIDYTRHLRYVDERLSVRQSRLLAAAFCRSIWHLYSDPHLRRTVELAEQFADGDCAIQELEQHRKLCRTTAVQAYEEMVRLEESVRVDDAERDKHDKWLLLHNLAWATSYAATTPPPLQDIAHRIAEIALQNRTNQYRTYDDPNVKALDNETLKIANNFNAAINRQFRGLIWDVVGNPFAPTPRFEDAWRTSTAVMLARGIYTSRDSSAMPILADALQDGGCASEAVLEHCRLGGTHVRGCWVIDHLLDMR